MGLELDSYKIYAPASYPVSKQIQQSKAPCCVPEYGKDEWKKILDKMIFAFKYELNQGWANPAEYEMKLYKEYFTDEVNEDNLEDKCNEKSDEGFSLFGKYFNGLWY
ncbi:hypothetical protein AGMMS50212_15090 [Spirochaetia bacterium]|nr:hypothetical protein AGMMS50212_15090 [Spirochaetia bacterium]